MGHTDQRAGVRGLEARLREAHRWQAHSLSPPGGQGGSPAPDTHQAKKTKTPPGLDSPSPQAGVPDSTPPQALQDTPTIPWTGLPIPPVRCARFYVPTGAAGHPDHPLGRTPRPPRPVGPVVHPCRPCRKLQSSPGLDSPSPQAGVPGSTSPQALQDAPTTPWAGLPIPPGRWARLSVHAGPAGNSNHPLGWTRHPPRPVCPVLRPHRPCRTLRPPPGQDSPSPRGGVPESTSPQAQQGTPTNPWAGLPIPPGRCARFYLPTGPAGHSDHPLGRTPHPPRPEGPVVHPRSPCRKLRPPPGLDSPSPQAGVPGSTSPQALQDAPTTPWAGLPIHPGRRAQLSIPAAPAGNSDHPLGWNPHPPRPVCPVLPPHRPCKMLRPPPGLDSPAPQAGVPGSTSPQALQDAPTTPWAGLPIPPGRWARLSIPAGPAGNSDHPLGWTPRPPRPVCPVLRPHRPCRTLRPPPGQDSPSPQAGGPDCPSPQALQETPTTPWAGLPIPPGRCARFYVPTAPAGHSDHPLGRTPHPPRPVGPVVLPRRPCRKLRPPLWAGLPIPPGRCARFYVPTSPAGHSDHPLGWTPHCPQPVGQSIAGVPLPTAPRQ